MNGAPANPMSGVAPSACGDAADRLGDVRDLVRGQLGQPVQVGAGPDRLRDDRAGARDDVDVDPDRGERDHDVAEEDRGVDAVAADRLERDLGDEVRGPARLEHRGALADLAVLRERAAGLAHEPHRASARPVAGGPPGPGGCRRGLASAAALTLGHGRTPGSGIRTVSRLRDGGRRRRGGVGRRLRQAALGPRHSAIADLWRPMSECRAKVIMRGVAGGVEIGVSRSRWPRRRPGRGPRRRSGSAAAARRGRPAPAGSSPPDRASPAPPPR